MEAMVAIDCREILPAIRVPTLLLHRRGDQVAHIEAARYMATCIPDARLVEFSGENHLITLGQLEPLLDHVEEFVAAGAEPLDPERDRVLATLLVANIVCSTATASTCRYPDRQDALDDRRAALQRELTRFRGHEIPPTEDGSIAAFFMSPSRAIACAQAIQAAVAPLGLKVRAGVHIGECDVSEGSVSGPPVHIADRVAEVADAGEILVTSTVTESEVTFSFHVTPTPHGIPGTRALYAVRG
jgi:class 3 adenylate cyclase